MRGKEVAARPSLTAVRILAAICAALAGMCVAVTVAWKHERDVVNCFQYVAEQDRVPQDRECVVAR